MMSPTSASSSESRSYHDQSPERDGNPNSAEFNADDVPVEVLVKHLLAAKQSLSSMTLVLRAHDLATHAREMHEEAIILSAQTSFLRQGISEQVRILRQVRRGMTRAYEGGRRDFKNLLRTLDAANSRLEQAIDMLRDTVVDPVFRPPGEEKKCLMDFVDEKTVETMRDTVKESIKELQAAQTSFDGDLLRFDTDLRALTKTMASAATPASPDSSDAYQPMSHLLGSLTAHSHDMAQHLGSLNRHFDMCVKAVRTTEGGAALALRKAAEVTDGGDPVSISGVIADQDTHAAAEIDSMDPQERAEVVQVVVQDAPEVDEVVAEIQAVLQQMEADFGALKEQTDQMRAAYVSTIAAFYVLEEIGTRLQSYVQAEAEFAQRWEDERSILFAKLEEMDELKRFYEGYYGAYDSLLLEVERRRSVQEKITATWRKAKETVDKLVEADRKEREHFRQEIGEFLPTDLWAGMTGPTRRWEVVAVDDDDGASNSAGGSKIQQPSTPTLKNVRPADAKRRETIR
ncbi:autophagy-related protein 17 [Podospora aff. communis PSN243]|uniref:Autophagy-related protein 17 n=1 Tax=Podospora aff. communis PSN243 TaxID=3040156 RepID=A0AAV9GJE2_9PEZI|nr:autophagy-related protein 17 [Podospora aff. communis PSN243]